MCIRLSEQVETKKMRSKVHGQLSCMVTGQPLTSDQIIQHNIQGPVC